MEGQIQQAEDKRQGQRNDDHQPLLSAAHVLELASPFEIITGRQTDFPFDASLGFFNERSDIASAHVRLNDDPPLPPLALDGRRASRLHHAG